MDTGVRRPEGSPWLQNGAMLMGPFSDEILGITIPSSQPGTPGSERFCGWYLFLLEALALVPRLFYIQGTQTETPCQSLGGRERIVLMLGREKGRAVAYGKSSQSIAKCPRHGLEQSQWHKSVLSGP